MNNFDKVFLVVKKHCGKQKNLAEISSFAAVAKEAGVLPDKLAIYLDYLQDMGLIKYSLADNYIHLTTFGSKQESLVKEDT